MKLTRLSVLAAFLFCSLSHAKTLIHPTCYLEIETAFAKSLGVSEPLSRLLYLTELLTHKGYVYISGGNSGPSRMKLSWSEGYAILTDVLTQDNRTSSDSVEAIITYFKQPNRSKLEEPTSRRHSRQGNPSLLSASSHQPVEENEDHEDCPAFRAAMQEMVEKMPKCAPSEKRNFNWKDSDSE